MRLKKTYQDGGKKPKPAQRDTIQKILRTPMLKNGRRIVRGQVDSDQGAIPISEYTPEEMAAYQKYSEENFPFVDFDIHEFVADRRAKQQPPTPTPQPQQPTPPASIALRRQFPLPPPQNQILGTDQRQLAEMLFDERRKGREAVRVMKADQTMKTGATPSYDVYWDDKRKQWKMRDIPQEEIDRYRRQNAIRRTSVSF